MLEINGRHKTDTTNTNQQKPRCESSMPNFIFEDQSPKEWEPISTKDHFMQPLKQVKPDTPFLIMQQCPHVIRYIGFVWSQATLEVFMLFITMDGIQHIINPTNPIKCIPIVSSALLFFWRKFLRHLRNAFEKEA